MSTSGMLRFASVISAYWAVAIAMVFVSKRLMSGSEISSDISLLLVWVQNIIAMASIGIPYLIFQVLGQPWTGPVFNMKMLVIPDMIYASVTFTGTLVFNNLMLKYISVAFYQVARSLTLIFVISFSAMFLKERVTSVIIVSCMLIISGFYISVDVEMISHGVQVVGIVYGVAASLMAALCGVFFKRVQKNYKLGTMQLALNNSLISFAAMTPLILSTGQLRDFVSSPAMWDSVVWTFITLSGLISLVMGWISAMQITVTSPLTHNISINAKSVFQTLLAVAWSGESRSTSWWVGNVFVIAGIAAYTSSKIRSISSVNNYEKEYEPPSVSSSSTNANHYDDGGRSDGIGDTIRSKNGDLRQYQD